MALGAHKECLQLKQHATNRLGSFRFDKRSYPLVLAASVRNVKKLMTTPKLMSLPSAEANLGVYLYTKNGFTSCNERSGNLGVVFCHVSFSKDSCRNHHELC